MNNLSFSRIKAFPIFRRNILSSNSSYPCFNPCSVSSLSEYFGFLSLHTSSEKFKFAPSKPPLTKYKKPVDWLPFPWHRRPKFNLYEKSGDMITELQVDPTLPKPDFELSEELKLADETVKNTFTLATASKNERKEVHKRMILKRIQRHPFDLDSLEVKIALRTLQIRSLYEHYRMFHKKEVYVSRIVLPIIILKRNKLLRQLRDIDEARFNWLLEELKLYFEYRPVGLNRERYCKRWDLRRLTKQHCEKIIADKKAAYHEELKKQQIEFLEEKQQTLAWIEEETKALNSLKA